MSVCVCVWARTTFLLVNTLIEKKFISKIKKNEQMKRTYFIFRAGIFRKDTCFVIQFCGKADADVTSKYYEKCKHFSHENRITKRRQRLIKLFSPPSLSLFLFPLSFPPLLILSTDNIFHTNFNFTCHSFVYIRSISVWYHRHWVWHIFNSFYSLFSIRFLFQNYPKSQKTVHN